MRTVVWLACAVVIPLGGCNRVAAGQQQLAAQSRVKDAVSAYEAARAHGDTLAICVQAGAVAAAYADARDLANQQAWNARRREDCARAYAAMGGAGPSPASPEGAR